MNFSWPNRATGKAARRSAARGWAVGITVVATAGAVAMAAPAMSALASTHAAKHATTTKMSAVSGYVGTKVTLAAKVTGSTPKGTVKFIWGHTTLCSATLSNGTAKCWHVFGGVGSLRVEALYTGNASHKSSSAVATVKVLAIKTSVKVTASPAATSTGTAVKLTAVVSPTASAGYVTFSVGATTLSKVKVVSGKATLTHTWNAGGAYTVTAVYGGNATHAKSSGTTKVTVAAPAVDPTTTVVTNNFPITEPLDTPATVNVQVTDDTAGGPAPTGTVLVTSAAPWADNAGYTGPVEACTATLTPAAGLLDGLAYSTGSCGPLGGDGWGFIELGAIYTPDSAAFAASNNDGTEVKIINLYPDTTTVTAPAGTAGDPVTLVATLGGPGGGNVLAASPEVLYGGPPNPDTITFTVTDDTDAVVATCDVVPLAGGTTAAANYADCDVTLPAGTYTVTADFAGDEYAAPSTGTGTLTIEAAED
jgi:hypothetical protein